jgi:tight adherence protein B
MIPAVALVVLLGLAVAARRRRRVHDRRRATANVAMQLARSVRSGATLPEAVAQTAALLSGSGATTLDRVVRALQRGVAIDDALSEWGEGPRAEATSAEDVALVVAAARFGSRHGGDVARALESVALTLLDRAELAEETAALSSQSRASVAVLCLLPLLGGTLLASLDPEVSRVLLRTPLGWVCLLLAAILDGAAVAASELLLRRALR